MSRSCRKHETRKKTENLSPGRYNRTDKAVLFAIGEQYPHHSIPRTRGECESVPRPCPYVGCKYHNYLEVRKNGNITFNFPDVEPQDMTTPSCVLDVADDGGATLEQVGEYMNLTRERVRQVQNAAVEKILPDLLGHE